MLNPQLIDEIRTSYVQTVSETFSFPTFFLRNLSLFRCCPLHFFNQNVTIFNEQIICFLHIKKSDHQFSGVHHQLVKQSVDASRCREYSTKLFAIPPTSKINVTFILLHQTSFKIILKITPS
jgi:hypothetical protein